MIRISLKWILFEPWIVDIFTESPIFGVIYKIGSKLRKIIAFFEMSSEVISSFFPDYEYCFSLSSVPLPPLPSHSIRNQLRVDLRLANSRTLFCQLFRRISCNFNRNSQFSRWMKQNKNKTLFSFNLFNILIVKLMYKLIMLSV